MKKKQKKNKKHSTPKTRYLKPQPCSHRLTRVLETRRPTVTTTGATGQIRRRLECLNCGQRRTEYATARGTAQIDRYMDRRRPLGY